MATASDTPRLPLQPRPGAGARLLRRLGGAVRTVIAGGKAFAAGLRRPAAPRPDTGTTAEARTTQPRPAPSSNRNAPFSLAACPGIGPELRAVLNTPLDELDPDTLRALLASFAAAIAQTMPPGSDMADAAALFAKLSDSLSNLLPEPAPPEPAPPETAPAIEPQTPARESTAPAQAIAPTAPAKARPRRAPLDPTSTPAPATPALLPPRHTRRPLPVRAPSLRNQTKLAPHRPSRVALFQRYAARASPA